MGPRHEITRGTPICNIVVSIFFSILPISPNIYIYVREIPLGSMCRFGFLYTYI